MSPRPRRRTTVITLALILVVTTAVTRAGAATEFGSIRGRVMDDQGSPVASAEVTITSVSSSTVSGPDGSFEFNSVPAGIYTLEFACDDYAETASGPVEVKPNVTTEVAITLIPRLVALKEINVTASASLLAEEPTAAVALDRRQIQELPHFGDDLYRAIAVLPSTTGADFSARFAIRGGLYDETLVNLDGQELMEPFHLKDFQGIFSILDPEMIGGVELTPGGFTAEYGDRMTGVLDMVARSPSNTRTGFGISFTNAWANSVGRFAGGEGSWIASARRGYLDLILNAAGADDDNNDPPDPRYWDLFGKLSFSPSPSHSLSLAVLVADDDLIFKQDDEDDFADVETGYTSRYAWLSSLNALGSSSFVTAALYVGDVSVDRGFVVINNPGSEELSLNDIRGSRFFGLRTGWEHDLSKRHYFRWGFDLRHYESDYDYELNAVIEDPINDPRFYPGTRVFSFHDTYEGEQYSLYATDRIRISDRFTAEIGLRFDRQTLIDDDQLSPRVNLLYKIADTGALRLGWGHFAQSQRPYELMVQFGQTEFLPYQCAEQLVLGYETGLGKNLRTRIDAYARKVRDPHPRWETIFGPWHPIPEVATDLAEISPESVEAYGLELSLASRLGGRFDWWASYVFSSIEDVIAGRNTPRYLNQPHAFTTSVSWHPGPKWALTGVIHYHTGWPGTAVSANVVPAPEGGLRLDYEIGAFYEECWEDYLRLDLRASWTSRVGRKGELSFFIDVQNLTDRENQRGIGIADPDYEYDPGTGYMVSFPRENWLPIIPSFGVSYEF